MTVKTETFFATMKHTRSLGQYYEDNTSTPIPQIFEWKVITRTPTGIFMLNKYYFWGSTTNTQTTKQTHAHRRSTPNPLTNRQQNKHMHTEDQPQTH